MEENKFNVCGKSLLVPSVQELAKDPNLTVPSRYIQDDQTLISDDDHALNFPGHQIPVIDFQKLVSEQSNGSDSELEKFHLACKEWGFFQVRTSMYTFFIINYLYTHTYEPSSSCFKCLLKPIFLKYLSMQFLLIYSLKK